MSLGPEGGGGAQILKCVYTSTFFYSILMLCQKFGGVFKLDCCLWEGTIFKMYVQFNIPDFILIFVPNILGSYQIGLLSLGPVEPRGGKGTLF